MSFDFLRFFILTSADEPFVVKDPESLKVRNWRHMLQKYFLGHKGLPKSEVKLFSIQSVFVVEGICIGYAGCRLLVNNGGKS